MSVIARRVVFGAVNKYRNKPTVVEGIKFPSMKEAGRYAELRILEKAGRIRNLDRQVVFVLEIQGQKICSYRADFVYEEYAHEAWTRVVEDSKGMTPPVYRLKKKLMKAILGIDIRES